VDKLRRGEVGSGGVLLPMEDKMESTRRHDFRSGRGQGERPHGNMRMVEGPDGFISLRKVIPDTFILTFFIMITRLTELFIKRIYY
jgi:hypothetical protein